MDAAASTFAVGDAVRITGGAFANFSGTILDAVDVGRGLRVELVIFGRTSAVEVRAEDIEKAG